MSLHLSCKYKYYFNITPFFHKLLEVNIVKMCYIAYSQGIITHFVFIS